MSTKEQMVDAFRNVQLLNCLYRYIHWGDVDLEGQEFEHYAYSDWSILGDECVRAYDYGPGWGESEIRRMMLSSNNFTDFAVVVSYVLAQNCDLGVVKELWELESGEVSEQTVTRYTFNGEVTNFS